MLPIAVGGALALLAIIAIAAILMGRRRRRREQQWADEQTMSYEPFETAAAPQPEPAPEPAPHVANTVQEEQAAAAAPSAFAWGNSAQPAASSDTAAEDNERRPGETWVERAYRGPSPSNPSVSLRHRLSRAAFFDKRERDAAAGLAAPLDTTAGLPQTVVDEQERESA